MIITDISFFFSFSYRHCLVLITFSISMYIMCGCLFSDLSRRVGAIQISIIIILLLQYSNTKSAAKSQQGETTFTTNQKQQQQQQTHKQTKQKIYKGKMFGALNTIHVTLKRKGVGGESKANNRKSRGLG